VTSDRDGNFYYAGFAANAAGQFTIQVNKSVDSGRTWSAGRIVAVDANGDKEWIAVGPDPVVDRENVYVTWTSFRPAGAQLWLGKSIDGGATWTTRAIFATATNPNRTCRRTRYSSRSRWSIGSLDASTSRSRTSAMPTPTSARARVERWRRDLLVPEL